MAARAALEAARAAVARGAATEAPKVEEGWVAARAAREEAARAADWEHDPVGTAVAMVAGAREGVVSLVVVAMVAAARVAAATVAAMAAVAMAVAEAAQDQVGKEAGRAEAAMGRAA